MVWPVSASVFDDAILHLLTDVERNLRATLARPPEPRGAARREAYISISPHPLTYSHVYAARCIVALIRAGLRPLVVIDDIHLGTVAARERDGTWVEAVDRARRSLRAVLNALGVESKDWMPTDRSSIAGTYDKRRDLYYLLDQFHREGRASRSLSQDVLACEDVYACSRLEIPYLVSTTTRSGSYQLAMSILKGETSGIDAGVFGALTAKVPHLIPFPALPTFLQEKPGNGAKQPATAAKQDAPRQQTLKPADPVLELWVDGKFRVILHGLTRGIFEVEDDAAPVRPFSRGDSHRIAHLFLKPLTEVLVEPEPKMPCDDAGLSAFQNAARDGIEGALIAIGRRIMEQGGNSRSWDVQSDEDAKRLLAPLGDGYALEVLRYVAMNPGVIQTQVRKQVAAKLGSVSDDTIRKALMKLKEAGYVEELGQPDGTKQYFVPYERLSFMVSIGRDGAKSA